MWWLLHTGCQRLVKLKKYVLMNNQTNPFNLWSAKHVILHLSKKCPFQNWWNLKSKHIYNKNWVMLLLTVGFVMTHAKLEWISIWNSLFPAVLVFCQKCPFQNTNKVENITPYMLFYNYSRLYHESIQEAWCQGYQNSLINKVCMHISLQSTVYC